MPIPVILDTDIGDDIDDTWALGMLMKSPELDTKLVVGDLGQSRHRAALIAKLLQRGGRTDIPVGIGAPPLDGTGKQAAWLGDYDLESYPGTVHPDGVQAMIDIIMNSPTPVTLISIAPMPNVRIALEREPRIAQKARFIGMHGSVRVGYEGSPQISAEWNVKVDPPAVRAAFAAPWDVAITPLDTCGLVRLTGEKYEAIRNSRDIICRDIMDNYQAWANANQAPERPQKGSSVLFDTVAIYMAFSTELLHMEKLGIRVSDDGFTLIDPAARPINVATRWKNLPAFEDFLVQRLTK